MNFDVKISDYSSGYIDELVDLFVKTYPADLGKFNKRYLSWQYYDNPAGRVISADAYFNNKIVAHYAVIPINFIRNNEVFKILWSVNTATHPDHQGRGLFVKLANLVYERAEIEGYVGVIGVANANSTHGFLNKLGFTLVGNINLRLGYGVNGYSNSHNNFQRSWSKEEFFWRLANPNGNYKFLVKDDLQILCDRGNFTPYVNLGAFPLKPEDGEIKQAVFSAAPKFFVGYNDCFSGFSVKTPKRLMPSPWNLIWKRLKDDSVSNDDFSIVGLDLDSF